MVDAVDAGVGQIIAGCVGRLGILVVDVGRLYCIVVVVLVVVVGVAFDFVGGALVNVLVVVGFIIFAIGVVVVLVVGEVLLLCVVFLEVIHYYM